jgi:hypothetical protein
MAKFKIVEGDKAKAAAEFLKFTGAAALGTGIGHYTTKALERGDKALEKKLKKKSKGKIEREYMNVDGIPVLVKHKMERDEKLSSMINELQDIRTLPGEYSRIVGGATNLVVGAGKGVYGAGKKVGGIFKKKPSTSPYSIRTEMKVRPTADLISEAYDPKSTAEFILNYLDQLYSLLNLLNNDIQKKQGVYTIKETNEFKSIIVKGILDYNNPVSFQAIDAQLRRIQKESGVKTESPLSVMGRIMIIGSLVGSLATLAGVLVNSSKMIKELKDTNKIVKMRTEKDQKVKFIFNSKILPKVEPLVDDILNKKLRTEDALELRFYKIIDNVTSAAPELEQYLSTWSAE